MYVSVIPYWTGNMDQIYQPRRVGRCQIIGQCSMGQMPSSPKALELFSTYPIYAYVERSQICRGQPFPFYFSPSFPVLHRCRHNCAKVDPIIKMFLLSVS